MLLDKDTILEAAKLLLTVTILDELEDVDSHASLPEGMSFSDDLAGFIIENHTDDVMLVMGYYIGAIGEAWKSGVGPTDIGLVFYHMGLQNEDELQAELLYRLIMSCWGHGIGIDDDSNIAEAFDKAGGILCNAWGDQGKRFDRSPTNFDQHCSFTDPLVSPHLIYGDEE